MDEPRSRIAEISFPVFELWSFCWAFTEINDTNHENYKSHSKRHPKMLCARLIHYRSLQPLTSSFFQGCCQMHPAKNWQEVNRSTCGSKHTQIYETWWNMIANNHTKLKETQTTKLDALLHVANNFANFNDLKRACHQFQWPSALVVQLFEAHEDVPPRVGAFTVTTVTARSSLSTSPTGLTNCFLNFITIHSFSFKRSWQWWNVVNVVN